MENLQAQRQLQKNAEKLTQALSLAFEALYGAGTSDGGALAELAEAEAALSRIETCSAQLPELVERLRSSRLDTEDVAEQLRDLRSSLDFSPEAFERLEERLDQLRRLSRKYGQDEAAMLAYLDSRKEELEQIESAGQRLQELQARMEEKKTACRTAAQALDEKRRKAAAALQARIAEELAQLNMPAVRFQVDFQEKADGDFDQNGLHEVRFLMSANAGQALGRISRIASGGELSRIMLAMKNVLAGVENIPTLVFDEIDTGVSGVAAQRVGEKLSQLAGTRQVLCVTHLPQIAAMGDIHFSIEKQTREGQTYTQVQPLSGQERERELARLYGGENITETTLHAAAEQLRAAADYKEKRRR